MFPKRLQEWARSIAEGVVLPLAGRGVSPNAVTVFGFALNVVTALVLLSGHLSSGGALLFLSGLFDMLDGALARVTSRQSDFGAFLDSVLDRYSEGAILAALGIVFTERHDTWTVAFVLLVLLGSLLSSYTRARAEGLSLHAKVGIAPRPERVLIMGLGLLLTGVGLPFSANTTLAALVLLAVLTNVTATQRIIHVWRQTRTEAEKQVPRSSKARKTRTT
jgi:CDP-diacylglycerol---glycerol-3-phosphate 3-phosphatidyltransferase